MPSQKDDLNNLVRDNGSEKDIMRALDSFAESELGTAKNMHKLGRIRNAAATVMGVMGAAMPAAIGGLLGGAAVGAGTGLMASVAAGTVGAAISLAGPALVWGKARLVHEVVHQIINGENANVSGGLTESMKGLERFENVNLDKDSNAFKVLKTLEKDFLKEGHKWAPDLNKMRKNLTKSQLLRQSILNTHGLDRDGQQDIVDKSTAVVESFEAWAKVQKGRYAPILNFVSNVLSSDKKDIPRVSDRSR